MVRGLSVGGLGGLASNFGHVGLFMEGGYTYGPVLEDAAGNRHNDGGGCFLMGVRGRLVTKL